MTKIRKATHIGNLQIGELSIPCAVLEDGTRVLSARGVTKALGGKRGGSHWVRKRGMSGGAELPVFISANNLKPFIDNDLAVALTEPIQHTLPRGGPPAYGVEASLLPQICDVWLKAQEAKTLTPTQELIAATAGILMRGLAHVGIIALVDEATGYQHERARKALEEILDAFIAKELRKWAKTFPDEFYSQMFRLRGWSYIPWSVRRPSAVGKYTNDLVYERLAPGVLEELRRLNPTGERGRRKVRHHQWLTEDVGHSRLREHLAAVIALMKASATWDSFRRAINRALPKYGTTLEMPFDDEDTGKTA